MNRRTWIVGLVAVGVCAAIVIGLLGARGGTESDATAQQALCTSLAGLQTATSNLTGLSPQTASKSDYQSAVSGVQSAWTQVASDASTVASNTLSTLDNSWSSFESAVKSVPGSDSVSASLQAVQTQGQALATTTKSTISGLNCP